MVAQDPSRDSSSEKPQFVPAESEPRRRMTWLTRARVSRAILCLLLLLSVGVFAWVADNHYPLRHWLFFMYAYYWLLSAFFAAASLAAGLRVVSALLPEPPRLGEKLALAFALGTLVFVLGIFVGGLLGLLGHVFFFAWPALMLGFGARFTWGEVKRVRRHLSGRSSCIFLPCRPVQILAAALMGLGLVAVYLQVMTPLNVGGDSYWYHLPIAEHYAASGAIRPFAEGWYLGTYPHLASWLYTWAFLAPGELFDHVALSSHLEYVLFVATVASLSPLCRRLLSGRRVPFAGAAIFLFPGLFLYDSSLITGADHVLAFWAPALGIALIRLAKNFRVREAVLAGALTGAAILTKYQASYLFVPTALFVLVLVVRDRRLRPSLAWALACLVVSSGHWLKNWIAHGYPFYPLLNKYLAGHPFHEGAADRMYWDAQFLLHGTFWEKARETLLALVTFSFVPHDWSGFHGERPVFGSLFTLLLPVLLFLRAMRRTWLFVIAIHIGILVWFVTTHQDRYLQALLPWMAACTVAILVAAWQKGLAVRAALVLLVAFQVVWGGDVYFIRSHAMIGDSPLKALVDHMALGQQKRYGDQRRLHFGSLHAVGERLPPGAKVLVHEKHDRLGLGAASISDTLCWQGAVDYMVLDTPDQAMALWRKMGATHVMWWDDLGMPWHDYLGREAVFARTVDLWGGDFEYIGDKLLTKLQATARDAAKSAAPTKIAWLSCRDEPLLGLYSARGLVERRVETALSVDFVRDAPLEAVAAANVAILRGSCDFFDRANAELPSQFRRISRAGEFTVWVRR